MKNVRILIFIGSLILFYCFIPNGHLVEGIVFDKTNKPLIGATIYELGTQNGAITDVNGNFSLKLLNPSNLIQVQYTGYNTITIQPKFGEKMNIFLHETIQLNEVVMVGHQSGSRGKRSNIFKRQSVSTPMIAPSVYYDKGSPENYKHFNDNPFKNVNDDPLTTMSIDVDRASYSNIRRYINSGSLPPKDAVRVEEMINYFSYDYIAPKSTEKHPFALYTTYLDCPWNNNHKLLHVAMKARELNREKVPSSNLVFLIDVSGSMKSGNKLPLVVESLKLLINQLNEKDFISIVTYAGFEQVVAKGIQGNQKEKLYRALDELNAEGSTAGASGIKRAYEIGRECFIEGGNNRVILATDGDFNVGESSEGGLVRLIEEKRKSGIYLSILGYGMGNYQDNKMQELSKAGNGNHFYIDDIAEAKKSLIGEFGSTVYAVANDVKFQLEFNPNHVSAYRVIGYENRQLENADFNDDTKDAGELGAGHVVTVIYEIIPKGSTSTFLKNVDPLKYTSKSSPKIVIDELATVKARYKKDLKSPSIKVEIPVLQKVAESASISESIQWSLIVAEFGLLLRDSPYKSNANFISLISKAKKIARDEHKLECVKLIEKAFTLSMNSHDTKDSNIE